jgi:hypothetical protein
MQPIGPAGFPENYMMNPAPQLPNGPYFFPGFEPAAPPAMRAPRPGYGFARIIPRSGSQVARGRQYSQARVIREYGPVRRHHTARRLYTEDGKFFGTVE